MVEPTVIYLCIPIIEHMVHKGLVPNSYSGQLRITALHPQVNMHAMCAILHIILHASVCVHAY